MYFTLACYHGYHHLKYGKENIATCEFRVSFRNVSIAFFELLFKYCILCLFVCLFERILCWFVCLFVLQSPEVNIVGEEMGSQLQGSKGLPFHICQLEISMVFSLVT